MRQLPRRASDPGNGVDMNEDGRACVLDGDPVQCPCGKNHVQASPDAGCSAG